VGLYFEIEGDLGLNILSELSFKCEIFLTDGDFKRCIKSLKLNFGNMRNFRKVQQCSDRCDSYLRINMLARTSYLI